MDWQYLLLFLILFAAVGYMLWRGWLMWKHVGDKCYGCSGCALHDEMLKKHGKKHGKPACFHKT